MCRGTQKNSNGIDPPTDPPHTHTHAREQRQENKHSRMQGKWTNLENFRSEERKQSKNHCSPVKLESKKNDKKNNRPVEESGWEASSDRRKKPRPVKYTKTLSFSYSFFFCRVSFCIS